jgi:ABC-type nickel/cobalt efflux system permease component RcnA
MLPTPNLQQIAHQTQEFAKSSKDQRLGLVFQTVSMVSMAVLGVGAAVHLLREMLRNPHHHNKDCHDNHDEPKHRWSDRHTHENEPEEEGHHHRHQVRRQGGHGHQRS